VLDRRERMSVKLAVDVVRETMESAGVAAGDTDEVRPALRALLPHCPERWPLTMFWESAGQDHVIGREQGVNAAYNGILRQLERAGVKSDAIVKSRS
jgi:hypothetical protein